MQIFAFPKTLLVRKQRPPQYRTLDSYRPYVRAEFGDRCAYCRTPNFLKTSGSYSVDHYKPVAKFKELEWVYDNLFWCCHACNSRKRDYWPDAIDGNHRFIPNPCDHRMFEHLKLRGAVVESRTPSGEQAVEILDLNSDDRKVLRTRLQGIADRYAVDRKRIVEAIRRAESKLDVLSDPAKVAEVRMKRGRLLVALRECDEVLADLGAGQH